MSISRLDQAIVGSKIVGTIAILFQAREIIDDRGRAGATIGYFSTQTDAEAAAKKRGYFGDGDVREVYGVVNTGADGVTTAVILAESQPVTVDVDLIRYQKELVEGAKKKLLSTLTRQEMDALGIKL